MVAAPTLRCSGKQCRKGDSLEDQAERQSELVNEAAVIRASARVSTISSTSWCAVRAARVCNRLLAILRNEADAEDVAQEAC